MDRIDLFRYSERQVLLDYIIAGKLQIEDATESDAAGQNRLTSPNATKFSQPSFTGRPDGRTLVESKSERSASKHCRRRR